jgi:hypothetical protein
MAADNSVEEIIRKVVNAARSLDSYDLSTVRVTDRDGRKSEFRGRQIRVGNDYYRLFPSIVRRSERLDYRGREYVRQSPEDTWRTPEDSGRWVSAQIVEVENPPGWDEAFYSPNYGIDFNPFRDGERLPDELVQGRKAIRLSFSETIPCRCRPSARWRSTCLQWTPRAAFAFKK